MGDRARDCSVQRRNQKVIEESASPVLAPEQVAEVEGLGHVASRGGVCRRRHGRVPLPPGGIFAFLEVNTRLQVEHPITEVTTDNDLVKLQLHVAGGGRLEGTRPREEGHAVEARLNAEDPDRDFAPSPGRIALLNLPWDPASAWTPAWRRGFDPRRLRLDDRQDHLLGQTATQALARLRRAMFETTVVIEGGATNKSFILDLLDQPEVIAGSADTGWIGTSAVRGDSSPTGTRASPSWPPASRPTRTRRASSAPACSRPRVVAAAGPAPHRPGDRPLRGTAYRACMPCPAA